MKKRAKSTLGQTLVEFALVLTTLLLVIFGIFDFGSTFQAWLTVQNCAQTAARYATTGQPNLNVVPATRLQAIKDKARSRAAGLSIDSSAGESDPGYFHVYVYSADEHTAGVESPGNPNVRVAVDVIFNKPLITPLLSKIAPYIRLTGHSEMITERYRFPGYGTPAGVLPPPIPPTPTTYALTVTKSGTGSGSVTSNPSGINCGSTCSARYSASTLVTLTATASTGSTFSGWSGACSGTGTCSVTMLANQSVTAAFTLNTYALTVTKAGSGSGTVTSNPSGVSCGSTCSASFNYNQSVTLTAVASTGSTFGGWTGACSGTGTCTVTMSAAKSVTATFYP